MIDLSVAPSIVTQTRDGMATFVATGSWSSAHAGALVTAADARQPDFTSAPRLAIDMSGISAFDTFGAWHLARIMNGAQSRGQAYDIIGLSAQNTQLLARVQEAMALAERDASRRQPLPILARFGRHVADAGNSLLLLLNMLGVFVHALLRIVRRPASFRLTSTVHQIDRVGWQAIPIVLLITFLIGAIIAQQGFFHFRKFGAEDYVVDMVGILVLREIGVLIVAIMVAGRSGSSYTAELGSMKMREEIDALRTMGVDPVEVLIVPRVLALIIALPMLTFLGSMSALYGGEMVAWLYGGMSPDIFEARLREAVSTTHFKVGMIKAPFMALVIGIVACREGLSVAGSAESLGLRTTTSVVTSIFLVIVLDGLFAIFFASIGM